MAMQIPKFSDWKKKQAIDEKKQTWNQFAEKNKINKKIADKISKKMDGSVSDADCFEYVKTLVKDDKLAKKISSYWQMNESNDDEKITKLYKSSESKVNESANDFDLLVTFATKDIVEDNFENGQDSNTTTNDITEFEGLYDSFEALCKKLGFPSDPTKWCCIDDRIIYNQLEDADGNLIEKDSQEYESWEKGESIAFSCDYDFSIKFVPKGAPTATEIEEKLGIAES